LVKLGGPERKIVILPDLPIGEILNIEFIAPAGRSGRYFRLVEDKAGGRRRRGQGQHKA
jgi:hypothetical protein